MRSLIFGLWLLSSSSALAAGDLDGPIINFDAPHWSGYGLSATRLYRDCIKESRLWCELRVGNIMDAIAMIQARSPTTGTLCWPEGFSVKEGTDVFLAWAAKRKYPDELQLPSAAAVISALWERFPCPERGG